MKWKKGLVLALLATAIPTNLSSHKTINPVSLMPTQAPVNLERKVLLKDTKAVYASMWSMGFVEGAKKFTKLVDETSINSIIIDANSVGGYAAFKLPNNEHVQKYNLHPEKVDFDWPLKNVFASDIPVHFRFSIAKDQKLSKIKNGDYSVESKNGKKSDFVNLNSSFVRNYKQSVIIDSIEEAKALFVQIRKREPRKGEISVLLDYIRNADQVDVPNPFLIWEKGGTIPGYQSVVTFVRELREKLPSYVEIGVCVYGSVLHSDQDNNIGQNIPEMMRYADSLWPMSYPDHNSLYLRIWENPRRHFKREVRQAKTLTDKPVIMWIQAYKGKPWFRKKLNERNMSQVAFVGEQIEGTESAGAGWAAWHSKNKYPALHAATYEIRPEVQAKIDRESKLIRLVEAETNTTNAEISMVEARRIVNRDVNLE